MQAAWYRAEAYSHQSPPRTLDQIIEWRSKPRKIRCDNGLENISGLLRCWAEKRSIQPGKPQQNEVVLELDADTVNARIGAWLHDVAHQRINGTTGEQPQVRLSKKRWCLQPLPSGKDRVESLPTARHACAMPVESLQHPLMIYDALLGALP